MQFRFAHELALLSLPVALLGGTAWYYGGGVRGNYPGLSEDQAIFDFTNSAEPRGGWSGVRQPTALDARVSGGTSWPLRIRVTLKLQTGDYTTLSQLHS